MKNLCLLNISLNESGNQEYPFYLTSVRAGFTGFASPAEDYIEEWIDLNRLLIKHPAATFFVRVSGDSMTGAGILDGDVLVVDRSLESRDGKVVIAVLNGELTVKRLSARGEKVILMSGHPDYPDYVIGEDEEFQIWGVVSYVIHEV